MSWLALPSIGSRIGALLLVAMVACAAGCKTKVKQQVGIPDTLDLPGLAEALRARYGPLTTLWASGKFEASIVDPSARTSQFVNGELILLFRKPRDFRLVGKKPLLGENVFDLGSNEQSYWLKVAGGQLPFFFGSHQYAARVPADALPVRPDLVLEVLGVAALQDDLTRPPAPTLRYNPDADAYMLLFVSPADGHLAATKEVWYDRQTLLPTLVILFDASGRPALRAYLRLHEPLDNGPAVPVARRYELFFPATGSTLTMTLDEVRDTNRRAPNDASFRMPSPPQDSVDLDRLIARQSAPTEAKP